MYGRGRDVNRRGKRGSEPDWERVSFFFVVVVVVGQKGRRRQRLNLTARKRRQAETHLERVR